MRPMNQTADRRPRRILVVDDHEVVRQGLVALLDRYGASEDTPVTSAIPAS